MPGYREWGTIPACYARGKLLSMMAMECDVGYIGGGGVTCLDTGNWVTIPICNARGKLYSMMAQRQWSVMLDTLPEVASRAWIPELRYCTGL